MNAHGWRALLVIFAILAAAFGVVAIIVMLGEPATSVWASFSKTAAVLMPVVPSIIAALVSIVIYYNQRQASTELERQKAELMRKLEDYRKKLSEGLEFIKGKLGAERKAYDELHAAAILYYYTLARLEIGKLKPELVTKADDAMLAACRYSAFVPKVDRDLWMHLWQAARALGEKAEHVVDPQAQAQLWKENIAHIAKPMKIFSDAVMNAHQQG